jgi:hypothetical protein
MAAAYAVIARIDRVDPHFAGRLPTPEPGRSAVETLDLAQAIDLVGRPPATPLAERLARVREIWDQTTFFLFDVNSWR